MRELREIEQSSGPIGFVVQLAGPGFLDDLVAWSNVIVIVLNQEGGHRESSSYKRGGVRHSEDLYVQPFL